MSVCFENESNKVIQRVYSHRVQGERYLFRLMIYFHQFILNENNRGVYWIFYKKLFLEFLYIYLDNLFFVSKLTNQPAGHSLVQQTLQPKRLHELNDSVFF